MAASSMSLRSLWLGSSLKQRNISLSPFAKSKRFHCKANVTQNPRVYAHHTFYKGKSAMAFGPGKPSYKSTQDGGVYVEKEGSLFLEFVPSSGPRQYDWSRKQIMAVSVVEVGSLVGYTMTEGIEFLHDPHLGTSEAGMVRKTLKIEPMPDKSGMFFTFEVVNKVEDLNMRLSVPITKGEFTVIRSSCNFIIPYLLGWHGFINPSAIQLASSNHADAELEWSK